MKPQNTDLLAEARQHLAARRIVEALRTYDRAQAHGYPLNECAAGRWNCWMMLGKFELAWHESNLIEETGARDSNQLWDGRDFKEKKVLLRTLHGLGDSIQFVRYAPLIRRRAKQLVVQTHSELMSLLRNVEGVDGVTTWPDFPEDRAEWDQQIEVMELPRAFRTTIDSIPARIPYISLEQEQIEKSGRRLSHLNKPKVGLAWAASEYDRSRSMTLKELSPVLTIDAFSFYSFQRGPELSAASSVFHLFRIQDTSVQSPSLMDTAADLANMDLLISVDTFVAHLAAALGGRVWLMLPFRADWRWMINRDDSPWYPTMRLFRQPRPGDWESVVSRIAAELRAR
jgi:hypothetical protein